jgi:Flp pilus assembly protein TadD
MFLALGAIAAHLCVPATRAKWLAIGTSAAVLLAVQMILTIQRNRVWSDPVVLWTEATERSPRMTIAHHALGDALRISAGDCAAAETAYRRAIELDPSAAMAYVGLSRCQMMSGQLQGAAQTLRLAILEAPANPDARLELAVIEGDHFRDFAAAARLCREAERLASAAFAARACAERYENRLTKRP